MNHVVNIVQVHMGTDKYLLQAAHVSKGAPASKKRPRVDFFDKANSVGLNNLCNQEHIHI